MNKFLMIYAIGTTAILFQNCSKLDDLSSYNSSLQYQIGGLENKLNDLEGKATTVSDDLDDLESRVSTLEIYSR